ncbi:MAG: ceramidase domain-containing protein [Gemmatimonadaceae bacterium]
MRQPANAWSSLAFVLVSMLVAGHAIAIRSKSDFAPTNAMEKSMVYPMTFALASMFIGLGSAFYHASLTFAGQFVDVFGMYLIATFILVYNIGRLRPISSFAAVASYVLLNAVLAALLYEIPALRRFMFALVLLLALATEIPIRTRVKPKLNGKLLWSAIAALAVGFAFWILDITKTFCAPSAVLQGHAVWHVAGAVSTLLLYFFYCSEGKWNYTPT